MDLTQIAGQIQKAVLTDLDKQGYVLMKKDNIGKIIEDLTEIKQLVEQAKELNKPIVTYKKAKNSLKKASKKRGSYKKIKGVQVESEIPVHSKGQLTPSERMKQYWTKRKAGQPEKPEPTDKSEENQSQAEKEVMQGLKRGLCWQSQLANGKLAWHKKRILHRLVEEGKAESPSPGKYVLIGNTRNEDKLCQLTPTQRKIYDAIAGGAKGINEIVKKTKLGHGTVSPYLGVLKRLGLVKKLSQGNYAIPGKDSEEDDDTAELEDDDKEEEEIEEDEFSEKDRD